jgi:hypothetical protein
MAGRSALGMHGRRPHDAITVAAQVHMHVRAVHH